MSLLGRVSVVLKESEDAQIEENSKDERFQRVEQSSYSSKGGALKLLPARIKPSRFERLTH